MAATLITNTILSRNTAAALPTNSALDASDGAKIPCAADQKMLLILEKTSVAGDLTIKAGTGVQGVSDLVVSFDATGTKVINIESGKYNNGGYIYVTGTGKAACIVLP